MNPTPGSPGLPPDQLPDGSFDHDVHVPMIVKISIALIVVIVLTFVGVIPLFRALETAPPDRFVSPFAGEVSAEASKAPQPALQVVTTVEIERLRGEEQAKLTHYAWTDSSQAVAQVPIERAMEILVEQGVDVFAPVEAEPAGAGDGAEP